MQCWRMFQGIDIQVKNNLKRFVTIIDVLKPVCTKGDLIALKAVPIC